MAPLYTQAMTNGAVRLLHQCTGHGLARVRQERQQLWDRGSGLGATLARDRREQRRRTLDSAACPENQVLSLDLRVTRKVIM